jgi:predicted naringenin-chalcone synthase
VVRAVDRYAPRAAVRHPARLSLAQLGCAGGVAGLSVASEIVRRDPSERVLVVSAETPSLQLQLAEPAYTELLAAAQFGDGAGAALVSRDEVGCAVLGTRSALLPEVAEGGRIGVSATGLRLVPSGGLPRLIRSRVRGLVAECAAASDVDDAAIRFVVAHPRGGAVLDAVASGMAIDPAALRASWAAWEACGNMVSASVYRALAEVPRVGGATDGDVGMMVAFGTGVACELAALRWHSTLAIAEARCR